MNCKLCLESVIELNASLNLASNEAKQLEVGQLIEKHLQMQCESLKNNTEVICRLCWQSLSSFHEFYIKVKQAQELLNIPKESAIDSVFIPSIIPNTESVVENNFVEESVPVKRKRGRPRRTKILNECDASVPFLSMDEIKVENQHEVDQLDVASKVVPRVKRKVVKEKADEDAPKRRRGSQRLAKSKQLLNESPNASLNLNEIKTESPKESENTNTLENSSGEVKREMDTNTKTSDCESDSDPLYSSEGATKKRYSEKTILSRQFDEVIAANFKLFCCLCEREPFKDFTELKKHFRVNHSTRGFVRCCGKKLLKRGILVDHIYFHQNPQYFKCPRCEKILSDRRSLENHVKGHDDKRERIYTCETCSKSFYRRAVFLRHTLLHAPEEEKIFSCPQCHKTFATKNQMSQHFKLVHLNMYVKICDMCGKSIRGRQAFRRHQEEHEGVLHAPIQCELCGATFTTKYGLARHMKLMHTEENQKPRTCPVCAKISPNLSAHIHHMKYMHNTQRKHNCPMCDKAFKRNLDLREHMSTHTGEVLYTCPHCPKTFNSNANMHSHRKKVHRKEWEEKRSQKYANARGKSVNEPPTQQAFTNEIKEEGL